MSAVLRIAIGSFVILHGLAHPILAFAPAPDSNQPVWGGFWTRSWLLGDGPMVKPMQINAAVLSALALLAAGVAFAAGLTLTKLSLILWIAGAAVSLLTLIVFWHKWFVFGVVIEAAMLSALLINS